MSTKKTRKRTTKPTATKKQQVVHHQEVTEETFHSGPIPTPEMLAAYSKIVPDSPERILVMAENESLHRQKLEQDALDSNIKDRRSLRLEIKYGQTLAALICLSIIGCGTYLAVNVPGAVWPGVLLSSSGLAGIITAYLKK